MSKSFLHNTRNRSPFLFYFIYCIILTPSIGCKKLVEINTPTTSISGQNVYSNDRTATAVITGLYSRISSTSITGSDLTSIGLLTGLASDELTLYSGTFDTRLIMYYQNNLNASIYNDFWTTIYNNIYITNLSLEGIANSTTLTAPVKKQLIGEAKFIRALCYFYLVNLYGDVPMVLKSEYTNNNSLARSPTQQIWLQIISDLSESKELLSPDYLNGTLRSKTTERVRPNKWAATAFLARCYLYMREWEKAEAQSSDIIRNTTLYNLDLLKDVFLMNSQESIWQLQPVNFSSNTEDAKTYIIPVTGPSFLTPVYASPQLVNSFENNDKRKNVWIDTVRSDGILYYYISKYKAATNDAPLTEYHTVLRLGEQYLIRAEARAQLGNFQGARDDINSIRNRAGLEEINLNDKTALLNAILHERQVELFTEYGHRWLDLKRTQKIDSVMNKVTPLKGGTWNINWQFLPIPSYDITVNGNLTQNSGY